MHSHIAIVGDSGELALSPDTSLTITDKNPMFNDVEMFSQQFLLPFEKNRHILKNLEARDSSMRAVDLDGERFRIVLDGLPTRTAVLKVSEDVVLQDSLDVNLDATNRTFKDMISDMRCRDVTVDDDILIGEKIGDVKVNIEYQAVWDIGIQVYHESFNQFDESQGWHWDLGHTHIYESRNTIDGTFQPPALGFSYPAECVTDQSGIKAKARQGSPMTIDGYSMVFPEVKESYINTVWPYPHAKYCNSRVCYSHHAKEGNPSEGYETADALVPNGAATPEDGYNFGPYWVLPANRPASGICFYVGYFLERLFKTLGVAYDMTALTNITDFNYMCFFTTSCKFTTENTDQELTSVEQVNEWLSSRGCGGKLSIDLNDPEKLREYVTYDQRDDNYGNYLYLKRDEYERIDNYVQLDVDYGASYSINLVNSDGSIGPLRPWTDLPCNYPGMKFQMDRTWKSATVNNSSVSAYVQKMYATNDNFPNVNVSEVIESLENSFGVRFCYDAENNKVTVRLLRDMFRDNQPPVKLKGTVISVHKKTEKITGVKMGYSAESDSQEQQDNVRYQKKDYDTTYNYIEYPQGRTILDAYEHILKVIDIGNMNCYVDPATGNAYRVKIDSDAKTVTEMRPSLFEVGGLKGVSLGDCSKENEDYVREFSSSFEPVITNNLKLDNFGNIRLVPFVDEDMEHEFLEMKVQNVFAVSWGEVYANYELRLAENYDPSGTDDGQSPLMNHDWGLAVGILRPGADDNKTYEYDRGYDGFDNSRWGVKSDDFAVTSDSFDCYGRFLGVSEAGSFSLKPSAYKPFRYKYITESGKQVLKISTNPKEWEQDATWLIPCNNDVRNADGTIASRILSRGMCDTFMSEFFYFLLHRQRYEVKALCTAAELADIPNKWLRRWEIDGKIGYLNTIEYSVDIEKGIGSVTIDFYSI